MPDICQPNSNAIKVSCPILKMAASEGVYQS